jgi:hypothetical protein
MIAYIVTSPADLRWIVDKASETSVVPALYHHRLALFDQLAHAIQDADSWSEPLVSALQVTICPDLMLEQITAGGIRRTWRFNRPGWDIIAMPYDPKECHLKIVNLTARTVGLALRDAQGCPDAAALPTSTASGPSTDAAPAAVNSEEPDQPPAKRTRTHK